MEPRDIYGLAAAEAMRATDESTGRWLEREFATACDALKEDSGVDAKVVQRGETVDLMIGHAVVATGHRKGDASGTIRVSAQTVFQVSSRSEVRNHLLDVIRHQKLRQEIASARGAADEGPGHHAPALRFTVDPAWRARVVTLLCECDAEGRSHRALEELRALVAGGVRTVCVGGAYPEILGPPHAG